MSIPQPVSRRSFLLAIGAAGLAGCTSATSDPSTTTPTAPGSTTVSEPASMPSSASSSPRSTVTPTTIATGPTGPSGATRTLATTDAPRAMPALAEAKTVATGLSTPWSVVFLPDGRALISERDTGKIKLLDGGELLDAGTVPDVDFDTSEGGLLGLCLQANTFDTAPWIYAYYTSADDNRIARLRWDGRGVGEPQVIYSGIDRATNHNGGRIQFGPDGLLYVGTGDAAEPDRSQDKASPSGKILRLTAEGKAAPDNPFVSEVWSFGHRNVQGLAWDSADRLWATEFGPSKDDELNLIEPGGNYGWPEVTGAPGDARFRDAFHTWPSTADCSPSGIAIVDDIAYVSALRGQRLWQVDLRSGKAVDHFAEQYGRLRDVVRVPQRSALWVLTNEGDNSRVIELTVG